MSINEHSLFVHIMSSTYGWLTESTLAFERPVPVRGVSRQSQIRLSSIIRRQQENQQRQLAEQRSLFDLAAKEGKVFTHDVQCDRRWTRPNTKARQTNSAHPVPQWVDFAIAGAGLLPLKWT